MKKYFVIALMCLVATIGNASEKRLIELQDSCINLLENHFYKEYATHNLLFPVNRWTVNIPVQRYYIFNIIESNRLYIDDLANYLWNMGCDLPMFDGDILYLIHEEEQY